MIVWLLLIGLLFFPAWSMGEGPQIILGQGCEVNWVAPVAANLAGYRIYLSRTRGTYGDMPVVAPPKDALKVLCPALGLLSVGQWFLVMKAVDTSGRLSGNSLEAPFEVILPPPDTTPPPPPTGVTVKRTP